ncbi:MAG: recombinase RecD [Bdellovibrio sp.]|nr:MAG: recombinase RecD [Bdellovibrio sp.]
MSQSSFSVQDEHLERLVGIVERITYHNPENGWTVLKVAPFKDAGRLVAVVIHQAKVFAGATMEFWGSYAHHPKHGEQFKAVRALEKKPATTAALEKYIGSGLIKGVGPEIARRIVTHFGDKTLDVFENRMGELVKVPGIASKKLQTIRCSWEEHRAVRDVMIFLQNYGISTLFATKIFKTYGNQAIDIVAKNPYRLAYDIYGIGFFSADRIALAMGFERTGALRLEAAIRHVLSASREKGHCFLTEEQIVESVPELLREEIEPQRIRDLLTDLLARDQVKCRLKSVPARVSPPEAAPSAPPPQKCYYSKGLYYDELTAAKLITALASTSARVDRQRARDWVNRYCAKFGLQLSDEQTDSVLGIVEQGFSILTGGPGCGKTTTTKVLAKLLLAMNKKVLLAAPTGRAAQRMTEVIGGEAKTLHRLLEWVPTKGGFKRDENEPLDCDFLIVDETSMLDISLAASLLRAVPKGAQVLFIGDPDQLPAVGAGDVLGDLLKSEKVPRFRLTKVFRQAEASSIIRFAHEINHGEVPRVVSPLAHPSAFQEGNDCLFVDADEATQDQIQFIQRAKSTLAQAKVKGEEALLKSGEDWLGRIKVWEDELELDRLYRPEVTGMESVKAPVLTIPEKFRHVDIVRLTNAGGEIEELFQVIKKVHPWSSLHFGMTALDTVLRLYTKTLPGWLGKDCEIQVLTPQVRGSLGTLNLNQHLQRVANPEGPQKRELRMGERIFRIGDRVIQTRNNYDLGVFNGDIGKIAAIDFEEQTCEVKFAGPEERSVLFEKDDVSELSHAFAITIHKSQGSEFQAVIIPVLGQHFNMLFRNLVYTGLTRAKKLAVFVGTRRAFGMAIGQIDNRKRQTALTDLIG